MGLDGERGGGGGGLDLERCNFVMPKERVRLISSFRSSCAASRRGVWSGDVDRHQSNRNKQTRGWRKHAKGSLYWRGVSTASLI